MKTHTKRNNEFSIVLRDYNCHETVALLHLAAHKHHDSSFVQRVAAVLGVLLPRIPRFARRERA